MTSIGVKPLLALCGDLGSAEGRAPKDDVDPCAKGKASEGEKAELWQRPLLLPLRHINYIAPHQ